MVLVGTLHLSGVMLETATSRGCLEEATCPHPLSARIFSSACDRNSESNRLRSEGIYFTSLEETFRVGGVSVLAVSLRDPASLSPCALWSSLDGGLPSNWLLFSRWGLRSRLVSQHASFRGRFGGPCSVPLLLEEGSSSQGKQGFVAMTQIPNVLVT